MPLHCDEKSEDFITDQLIPKYGSDYLNPGIDYRFLQNSYKEGLVTQVEFVAEYLKPVQLKEYSAHQFSLKNIIKLRTSFYQIEPRPNDPITVAFILKSDTIVEKVHRLNIQALYFKSSAIPMEIPAEGIKLQNVLLILATNELKFEGTLYLESRYSYRLEIKQMAADAFRIFSDMIYHRYLDGMGIAKKSAQPAVSERPGYLFRQTQKVKGKIFIVDDEVLVCDLVSRVLTKSGYQCFAYNDGLGLVDNAIKHKPDVIILDIRMPNIDGQTLLRRLKRNENTAKIPVIMLTGSQEKEDVMDAKSAGAAAYFVKSSDMNLQELVNKIDSLITKRVG
jgi:CheY-like chemotaxis protein